ncbi:MAG: hypothetical protein SVS85_04585, partial [Candidatus Nanohaloarchaea archaeon]|nr:hypothetical protein [Candidatus Nanohaloarchaea archaeon]
MQEHVEGIEEALDEETHKEFDRRVREQADFLGDEARRGVLDNERFTIGLELEGYVIGSDHHLGEIPDSLLEESPFNPELGLHNFEINTSPTRFGPEGVREQEKEVEKRFRMTRDSLGGKGLEPVLDAMWTLQRGESSVFLSEHEEMDGHIFPENMREVTRYHAIDNALRGVVGGEIEFEVPGASHVFPSILFESMATSIQPHLQIPDAEDFPEYHNAAVRTMAPVLALSTNSPFLPPDLYNDMEDPRQLVEDTFHELRIPIFEQAVNTGEGYEQKKVRVPRDIGGIDEMFERVAEDRIYAPALKDEETGDYTGKFWEWNYKRMTFWRWVRPVVGGESVKGACDEKSIRLEYRPLPTQPSLEDIVSLQVFVAGLLHGMVEHRHPVQELEWEVARDNFYSVVRNGMDAEITWIDGNGGRTSDMDSIFSDLFRYAEKGLEERGLDGDRIDE